jgi:hypothetical protein
MVASTAGIPTAACIDHVVSWIFCRVAFLPNLPNPIRVATSRRNTAQYDWHDGLGRTHVFDQGFVVTYRRPRTNTIAIFLAGQASQLDAAGTSWHSFLLTEY